MITEMLNEVDNQTKEENAAVQEEKNFSWHASKKVCGSGSRSCIDQDTVLDPDHSLAFTKGSGSDKISADPWSLKGTICTQLHFMGYDLIRKNSKCAESL